MKNEMLSAEGRNAFRAERILWLHERIRGGSRPNAQRLCEKFGVSESQAHRDVRFLRSLGAPLEFDTARGGFRYTAEFSLPDILQKDDTENSLQAISAVDELEGDSVQMRIPDLAEIEVDSKVSALELGKYIVSRGKGKNRYMCQFRNPDLFLGMIVASGQRVKIISPAWLRERLLAVCGTLLEENSEE